MLESVSKAGKTPFSLVTWSGERKTVEPLIHRDCAIDDEERALEFCIMIVYWGTIKGIDIPHPALGRAQSVSRRFPSFLTPDPTQPRTRTNVRNGFPEPSLSHLPKPI
jgi:hypothetical protein